MHIYMYQRYYLLQRITDRYLILGVASMVAIDLIILVTYTLVEGIMGKLDARRVAHSENPRIVAGVSIIIVPCVVM